MKIKALNCLMALIFSLGAFAIEQSDITMVSYEQAWRDSYGTLALKNNTKEQIHNVAFLITYYDMSGNEVDYKEYTREVEIAPGMTKKVDIPAYEHNRCYHYYKSEGLYDNTSFKIKFSLKDVNLKEDIHEDEHYTLESTELNSSNDYHKSDDGPSAGMIVFMFAMVLVIIGFIIGMYVLVAVMAQKRNRNVVVWILLSIVTTPILMAIILLVIGKENNVKDESYSKMQ